jgi:predicted PurR-regulated permease PerM
VVDRSWRSHSWGTVAFTLNYVPILGPAAAVFIFLLAGSLTITSTWQAVLPAALYGAIHVIEGETVTPMLLARRFTLNPVLVVFFFVFWFWLWGRPRCDPFGADSGDNQNRL